MKKCLCKRFAALGMAVLLLFVGISVNAAEVPEDADLGEDVLMEQGESFSEAETIDASGDYNCPIEIDNAMIKAFTVDNNDTVPTLGAVKVSFLDSAGVAIGSEEEYNLSWDTDEINIFNAPSYTSELVFTGLLSTGSSDDLITVTLGGKESSASGYRCSREELAGADNMITITLKSPDGNYTVSYIVKIEFGTTELKDENETDNWLIDTNGYIPQTVGYLLESVTSGGEYEAVAGLNEFGGRDTFTLYQIFTNDLVENIQFTLREGQTAVLKFRLPDGYDASKSRLYYVDFSSGRAVLTDVTDTGAAEAGFLKSVPVNNINGFYTLAVVKALPEIPALDPVVYSPNGTLADVTFPPSEGGSWVWDAPGTVPEVNTTSYPAKFTPDPDSSFSSYKAEVLLSVIPAEPEISVSGAAVTYGQTLKESTLTGTASCDGVNLTGGSFKWEDEATFPTVNNQGYGVIYTPDPANANYRAVTETASVQVDKKPVTVDISPAERCYGDINQEFVFTVPEGALVGNDTKDDLGITLSCQADETSPAGAYDITGTSSSDNYEVSVASSRLTVTKRPAKLIPTDITIAYNDKIPETFAYTVEGLVNQDTPSVIKDVRLSAAVDDKSPAGTYEITGTAKADNYEIAVQAGYLTIDLASLSATIGGIINHSALPESLADGVMVKGSFDTDEESRIILRDVDPSNTSYKELKEAAAKYGSLIMLCDIQFEKVGNINGNMTVTLAVGDQYDGNKVTVYHYVPKGKKDKNGNVVSKDTLDAYPDLTVANGTVSVEVYSLESFGVAIPDMAPVLNSLTFAFYDSAGEAIGEDYPYRLSPDAKVVTIDAPSYTYGLMIKSLDCTGSSEELTSATLAGTKYQTTQYIFPRRVLMGEDKLTVSLKSPGGYYTTTYTVDINFSTTEFRDMSGNENYISDANGYIPKAVDYMAEPVSSGANCDAVAAGLNELGGRDSFTLYQVSSISRTNGDPFNLESGQMVILRFKLPDGYDASETRLYYTELSSGGVELTDVTDSVEIKTGFLNSVPVNNINGLYTLAVVKDLPEIPVLDSVVYSPNMALSDVALPASDSGSWAWDAPNTIPDVNTAFYPATYTSDAGGTYASYTAMIPLSVIPAEPEINVFSAAITYGQTLRESSLTGTASCEGTRIAGGSFQWVDDAVLPVVENQGYEVKYIPDPTDANYKAVTVMASVQVKKKPVTVNVNSAKRCYGDVNPKFVFTVSVGSFVGNDTKDDLGITLSCQADETSPAGEYDITGTSSSDNYEVSVASSRLTVTKRPAKLIPTDITIAYNDKIPETFAYTVEGLVNQDTPSVIKDVRLSAAADDKSPAGTYEITGTAKADNYEITVQAGYLTIKQSTDDQSVLSAKTGITNLSSLPASLTDKVVISGSFDVTGESRIVLRDVPADSVAYKAMEKAAAKFGSLLMVCDIHLDKVENVNGRILVTLAVGNQYDGKKVTAYHYVLKGEKDRNGNIVSEDTLDEYPDLMVTDGTISLAVYSLGSFGAALQDRDSGKTKPSNVDSNPKTGDATPLGAVSLIMTVALAAAIMCIAGKRRHREH